LSGGERQRIALARLFLKNPSIVILDEPAAFLDALTEREVRKEFNAFFRARTALVITHRMVSLTDIDRIVVLDEHRIVEQGTLRELIDRKGKFFDLYEHPESSSKPA
jgi:ATP-binding cassette subfamily B protein